MRPGRRSGPRTAFFGNSSRGGFHRTMERPLAGCEWMTVMIMGHANSVNYCLSHSQNSKCVGVHLPALETFLFHVCGFNMCSSTDEKNNENG